ncbi:hypothetical protein BDW22DRAFT_534503 [Trametopsis cervina]|nr:hypothetical protein BDW22DRAFT_534503 [Trametopsis cervina]
MNIGRSVAKITFQCHAYGRETTGRDDLPHRIFEAQLTGAPAWYFGGASIEDCLHTATSMFTSFLQSSTRRTAASLSRQISSKSSRQAARSKHVASPEKLRALISLYHEADMFITPETLSEAIDFAFLERRDIGDTAGRSRELTISDLESALEIRRVLPKLSTGDSGETQQSSLLHSETKVGDSWSSQTNDRTRRLKAALYGTDPGDGVPKPGYEVLVEEHERVQQLLQKDRGH